MMNSHQKRCRLSDTVFLQRSFAGHLTSSRPDIAAWVRELNTVPESTDPTAPPTPPAKRRHVLREVDGNRWPRSYKEQHANTRLMSGLPRKQQTQKLPAARDENERLTRSKARKGERVGSTAVVAIRGRTAVAQEDDANTLPLFEEPSSASGYDVVSEGPSFPPPTISSSKGRSPTRSSSPKKKTVAKREDLALLSPTIEFCAFREAENWGIELPQSVKELWYRCDARRSTPPGTNPPIALTSKDSMRIQDTLEDAFNMAQTWRSITTEPHWISVVVGPILHLIRKLSVFQGKDKNSDENITVLDITPVEISPSHLCPYSSTSLYPDLDKRIDYGIGLSPSLRTLRTLRNATYNTVVKSINQTSTFCNFIPMFVNIEVKRRHVGKDPAIQLAAWVAAEFRKRLIEGWTNVKRNDAEAKGNGLYLGSPVFAIEIEADAWLLYVVIAQLKPPKSRNPSKAANEETETSAADQDFEIFFFGPMRLGDTYSMDDTKRLVENLCDICLWGQTEFRTWWEETILVACDK